MKELTYEEKEQGCDEAAEEFCNKFGKDCEGCPYDRELEPPPARMKATRSDVVWARSLLKFSGLADAVVGVALTCCYYTSGSATLLPLGVAAAALIAGTVLDHKADKLLDADLKAFEKEVLRGL